MPRKAAEMSPLAVSRLRTPGLHFVGGVAGLALQVTPSHAKSWLLRYTVGGKRREMGLGGYPDVGLADARRRAREEREKLDKGVDPILARREAQSALKAQSAAAITFEKAALQYIAAHESSWRNAKHAQQWRNTLETYAHPKIGPLLVSDVKLAHVLAVLEQPVQVSGSKTQTSLWHAKTETASRLRSRLELVLDWATARGYRDGLNPARWRGHLDKLLPAPTKIAKAVNYAALPVSEVGVFMLKLREQNGLAAKALEFAILTAARSGEVRGARWSEIDLKAGLWKIPADRMKAGKEHRVPLSSQAVDLLKALPTIVATGKHKDLVFPAARGGMLSDMTLTAVLRRMEVPAVPHGFRSTFRDWCSERTNYPNEVAEMALAHTIGDKVEAAYRRGDLLEKRVRLMADWAAFCDRVEGEGGEVIPINRAAA